MPSSWGDRPWRASGGLGSLHLHASPQPSTHFSQATDSSQPCRKRDSSIINPHSATPEPWILHQLWKDFLRWPNFVLIPEHISPKHFTLFYHPSIFPNAQQPIIKKESPRITVSLYFEIVLLQPWNRHKLKSCFWNGLNRQICPTSLVFFIWSL